MTQEELLKIYNENKPNMFEIMKLGLECDKKWLELLNKIEKEKNKDND